MIDSKIKTDIIREVENLKDELVDLTSEMIRIPSVNPALDTVVWEDAIGGETRVNELLQTVLDGIGLETDLWEEEEGRANLVGVCKGMGEGRSLIFNGHVDTVAPGPLDLWTIAEPYSGKIIDGKIYGRGACDMKGGNAAAIIAIKALLRAGYRPKGDVIIQSVAGEEMMNTDIGTGAAIQRGYRADAAIVMEPSCAPYRLAIVSTSPGALILTVTIHGKAAHTLLRNELVRAGGLGADVAVSAVDKAMIIYQGLLKLEEEWGQTKSHMAYSRPGSFTICPTTFAGGLGGLAFIPEECYIKYVIWHAPQETQEQVKAEIEKQISNFANTDAWLRDNPPILDWNDFWWPPYDLPMDAAICKASQAAYETLFNQSVEPTGFLGVDDASFLNAAGIPAITWGPGTTQVAHTANEHVEIRDLVDAAKLYALTIVEWCGV
ncbi:MAG: ArgE/DapE family deacylase [Anaerolineaceae bacterium]|nr:ArgE/DapE family deacylase [Anaerolineaceae bacterium]